MNLRAEDYDDIDEWKRIIEDPLKENYPGLYKEYIEAITCWERASTGSFTIDDEAEHLGIVYGILQLADLDDRIVCAYNGEQIKDIWCNNATVKDYFDNGF